MMIEAVCYHCTIQCGITINIATPNSLAVSANRANYCVNGDGWIRPNEKLSTFTIKIAESDSSNHLIYWVKPLPHVSIFETHLYFL